MVFLQEIHSSAKDDKTWMDNFKGNLFFPHGKTISHRVAIVYLGTKKIITNHKVTDTNGRKFCLCYPFLQKAKDLMGYGNLTFL